MKSLTYCTFNNHPLFTYYVDINHAFVNNSVVGSIPTRVSINLDSEVLHVFISEGQNEAKMLTLACCLASMAT